MFIYLDASVRPKIDALLADYPSGNVVAAFNVKLKCDFFRNRVFYKGEDWGACRLTAAEPTDYAVEVPHLDDIVYIYFKCSPFPWTK